MSYYRGRLFDDEAEDYVGLGPGAIKRLGYNIVDKDIRPIVRALNEAGYETWASCAGGTGHDDCEGSNKNGWISFPEDSYFSKEDLATIREIVGKHTNVTFKVSPEGYISFSKPIRGSW